MVGPDLHSTLLVEGTAERDVEPDVVTVAASLRSPVVADAAEALRLTLDARSALRAAVAGRHSAAVVSDTAVRVDPHMVEREERTGPATTEKQWVRAGFVAGCRVAARAEAADAAALVATFGAHDGAQLESPSFELSSGVERSVALELDCLAVQDARERAEAIAAAAGYRVGGVATIGEHERGAGEGILQPRMMAAKAEGDAVALEELLGELRPEPIRVSRRLPVRFRLEPLGTASG